MSKKLKITIRLVLLFFILAVGAVILYIKKTAPPGEDWIAYNNDKVIEAIDRQLQAIDTDSLIREKEQYVVGKSIEEIQKAVKEGQITYEELTAVCLYRIKTLDQKEKGYNSVISINEHAMEEAVKRDSGIRETGKETSGIYGIPVMLKDNINTSDMPTSAGAEAFSAFCPSEDAELVKKLKENGAVILGKNNLSEFANYVSSVMPSGYSGNKGQTVNPFGPLKISPSGSSSGSAVAVTADLVPVSVGTETDGSIVAPSSANSVVGFKPTRDSISGEGILPLIRKIDTAGPIAKSVKDAAIAYEGATGAQISQDFDKDALSGKTIGIVSYEYNDAGMLSELKKKLQELGADTVDVELDAGKVTVFNLIHLTFRKDYEDYAAEYGLPMKTLKDLLRYNEEEPKRRIKYGQDWLEEAENAPGTDDEISKSIQTADQVLDTLFREKNLDGIAFLNSTASTYPAAAGYPELTVPFGADKNNVPQGITFAARPGEDEKLLNLGYSFESHVNGRLTL